VVFARPVPGMVRALRWAVVLDSACELECVLLGSLVPVNERGKTACERFNDELTMDDIRDVEASRLCPITGNGGGLCILEVAES
jgi:hypothetical protein